jgi:hypothetical protein
MSRYDLLIEERDTNIHKMNNSINLLCLNIIMKKTYHKNIGKSKIIEKNAYLEMESIYDERR